MAQKLQEWVLWTREDELEGRHPPGDRGESKQFRRPWRIRTCVCVWVVGRQLSTQWPEDITSQKSATKRKVAIRKVSGRGKARLSRGHKQLPREFIKRKLR